MPPARNHCARRRRNRICEAGAHNRRNRPLGKCPARPPRPGNRHSRHNVPFLRLFFLRYS